MTDNALEQLSFTLTPRAPYALSYFVTHCGVAEAVFIISAAVEELLSDPGVFRSVYVYGPRGSGKTHILRGYADEAISRGLAPAKIFIIDLQQPVSPGESISRFEELRASGGLVFIEGRYPPAEQTSDPHLRSRLLLGSVQELRYPPEEELPPVLLSLLERRNMKMSEQTIQYILRRTPSDPLSFSDIFARIDRLSLRQGRPAGLAVAREVLSGNECKETEP